MYASISVSKLKVKITEIITDTLLLVQLGQFHAKSNKTALWKKYKVEKRITRQNILPLGDSRQGK